MKAHRRQIMHKMRARSLPELVRMAGRLRAAPDQRLTKAPARGSWQAFSSHGPANARLEVQLHGIAAQKGIERGRGTSAELRGGRRRV